VSTFIALITTTIAMNVPLGIIAVAVIVRMKAIAVIVRAGLKMKQGIVHF
jgi:hypothetical protein